MTERRSLTLPDGRKLDDLAFVKDWASPAGDVRGQPLAVRERDHLALVALPDGDRRGGRFPRCLPAQPALTCSLVRVRSSCWLSE
jgi:hypothetical protein